jgi:type VI secretion system VasD/TssJ family lipoprotein
LYDDDKGALGSDLIGERFSVTLRPSDQTVLSLEVGADVRFIAVAAFYRQYDGDVRWKNWIPTPVKGSLIVTVDKTAVSFTSK